MKRYRSLLKWAPPAGIVLIASDFVAVQWVISSSPSCPEMPELCTSSQAMALNIGMGALFAGALVFIMSSIYLILAGRSVRFIKWTALSSLSLMTVAVAAWLWGQYTNSLCDKGLGLCYETQSAVIDLSVIVFCVAALAFIISGAILVWPKVMSLMRRGH